MNRLTLTMSKTREILSVSGDHFLFKLNGYDNSQIKLVLSGLGIVVNFVDKEGDATAKEEPSVNQKRVDVRRRPISRPGVKELRDR